MLCMRVIPLEKTSCCFVDHNLSTLNVSEPPSVFTVNRALITVEMWIFHAFVSEQIGCFRRELVSERRGVWAARKEMET